MVLSGSQGVGPGGELPPILQPVGSRARGFLAVLWRTSRLMYRFDKYVTGGEIVNADEMLRLRREYGDARLLEADVPDHWWPLFERWLAEAVSREIEPNAMVLATAAADGTPSVRTVLMKGASQEGLVFGTNSHSHKGRDLAANPRASAVFGWYQSHRQCTFSCTAMPLPAAESDVLFAARPRAAQLAAHASAQSSVIRDRDELESHYADAANRYPTEVPRPEYWIGYRLRPTSVEFWQGGPARLHDRLRYREIDTGWLIERLAP